MAGVVLDASAVIAVLRGEPGAEFVTAHAGDALISAVNLQEVVKALLVRGVPIGAAREMIGELRLEVRAHESTDAYAAAALHEATKHFGAGLGDRSCMALGIASGLPVITTDRNWRKVAVAGLKVVLARN